MKASQRPISATSNTRKMTILVLQLAVVFGGLFASPSATMAHASTKEGDAVDNKQPIEQIIGAYYRSAVDHASDCTSHFRRTFPHSNHPDAANLSGDDIVFSTSFSPIPAEQGNPEDPTVCDESSSMGTGKGITSPFSRVVVHIQAEADISAIQGDTLTNGEGKSKDPAMTAPADSSREKILQIANPNSIQLPATTTLLAEVATVYFDCMGRVEIVVCPALDCSGNKKPSIANADATALCPDDMWCRPMTLPGTANGIAGFTKNIVRRQCTAYAKQGGRCTGDASQSTAEVTFLSTDDLCDPTASLQCQPQDDSKPDGRKVCKSTDGGKYFKNDTDNKTDNDNGGDKDAGSGSTGDVAGDETPTQPDQGEDADGDATEEEEESTIQARNASEKMSESALIGISVSAGILGTLLVVFLVSVCTGWRGRQQRRHRKSKQLDEEDPATPSKETEGRRRRSSSTRRRSRIIQASEVLRQSLNLSVAMSPIDSASDTDGEDADSSDSDSVMDEETAMAAAVGAVTSLEQTQPESSRQSASVGTNLRRRVSLFENNDSKV